MASVNGELRGGKVVCWWLGCKELAAYDQATGLCVACADHWRRYQAGESFPVPPPDTSAKYVEGKAIAGEPRWIAGWKPAGARP